MKSLYTILCAGIFACALTISAFAQTAVPPTAPGKVGLINISAFSDDKGGIAKYKSGNAAVEQGLVPVNNELKVLGTRYQTATTEYQTLQRANPPTPPAVLQAKAEEIQTLETNIKRKQEDGKAQYNKLYSDIMSPVINDIMKAMTEYAKQKGYAVILDGAKLEQADILLGFDDRYDVTKDFITFYNSRSGGSAPVAKPN